MDWLNYHHLLYFWTVAREGSIVKASEKLRLAQPTISGQLRRLEQSLGGKLFQKSGRGLTLTDVGQVVYEYAEQIFGLGQEMQDVLRGLHAVPGRRLSVGISDSVPKLIAYRILHPVLTMPNPPQLVCEEGEPAVLLADLASHKLDVVLADRPAPPNPQRRIYNHLLGSTTISLFATAPLARKLKRGFPASLHCAPFLFPVSGSALRTSLDLWLDSAGIQPTPTGEFRDSALLKTFGRAGAGVFAAPSAIESDVCADYGVQVLGRLPTIQESYFAVSVERRLKHPAVVALTAAARGTLFHDS